MDERVKEEVESLIGDLSLDCSVDEFRDNVNWISVSRYYQLSEDFIREFKDKVKWEYMFRFQRLSKNFIREFKDKVR